MTWTVSVTDKVKKRIRNLPKTVQGRLALLIRDIEEYGPVRGNWPNYSKLNPDRHHCHIKKGKPCYVAVWEERDRTIKLIEVIYVGTHEKAPY